MNCKVLVVGIDAMSPRIAGMLLAAGRLPNFARLVFNQLQTTIPPETPVAWSAAATGTNPGKYGIYDFINRNPQNYLPKLCLAEEKPGLIKTEYICAMRGTPFWKVLNEQGIETTIIRWPVTFPAQKIKGRMLSGLGVVDIRGSLNSYSFYTNQPALLELEGKEKVILLETSSGQVETVVRGPLLRKRGKLSSVDAPLKLEIHDERVIATIDQQRHELVAGKWSPFIRAKFKVLPFHEITGIFNIYLDSIKPHFRMYLSSVQIDPDNPAQDISYPKDYAQELSRRFGLFPTLGMPEETKAVTDGKLPLSAFIKQVEDIEKQREQHFFHELQRFKQGLFAFIFDAGDRLKHMLWESVSLEGEFKIPEAIERYYEEKDAFLGKVFGQLDPQTKLIVLSDHGFHNFEREVNVNTWLEEQGYLQAKQTIDSEDLFSYVDWPRSKAYALGFTSLFLNLKGREGSGCVEAAERQALVDQLISQLKTLEDEGSKVFTEVYEARKIYHGAFVEELAPDIVLGFSPGYRMSWKSAIGKRDCQVIIDNKSPWSGDHLIDRSHVPGVLFTNFEILKSNPEIIDIAPTIFKLFGLAPRAECDGEALI